MVRYRISDRTRTAGQLTKRAGLAYTHASASAEKPRHAGPGLLLFRAGGSGMYRHGPCYRARPGR